MSLGLLAAHADSTFVGAFRRFSSSLTAVPVVNTVLSRVSSEWQVELPLLKARWKTIFGCIMLQYFHIILTQLVYRFHVPAVAPLRDFGFWLTPELGPRYFWISEALFGVLFASFILWLLSPFWTERKSFYTIVVLKRLLVHIVCCQMLRAASFLSTVLPGPAHHCREGVYTSRKPWVHHWWEHFLVDVGRQTSHSCGDLIFSSHTIFILSFVLCYTYYGRRVVVKVAAWLLTLVLSVLIIASRKHYTVDVVVAWYVVPLIFLALERRWTTKRGDPDVGKSGEVPSFDQIVILGGGGRESRGSSIEKGGKKSSSPGGVAMESSLHRLREKGGEDSGSPKIQNVGGQSRSSSVTPLFAASRPLATGSTSIQLGGKAYHSSGL